MLKLGFLGGGVMANAMAKGFISAGLVKAENMIASCHPSDKKSAADFKALGAEAIFENISVVKSSEVVMISVKPSVVQEVLQDLKSVPNLKDKLFISIAMGITLADIEGWLPPACRVVRVMPNTPVLVREGAAVLVAGSAAGEADIKLTQQLFEAVGSCAVGYEGQLDAVTALSGSGPAYVYLMIEALADGGVKMGLPRALAQELAAQTIVGAGRMVQQTGIHPAQLRDNVTSPAGSTAAGLHHLEKNAFRGTVIGAIEAAVARCKEVAAGNK